jgi:hypothetical protein
MSGRIYQWWSRLIHRHGYHHTRVMYLQDELGHVDAIAKCDWCGLSARAPRQTGT